MRFRKTQVDIDGLRRLRSTLRKAGGDIKDLRQANRDAAESIVPIAAGMAPIGKTGNLKASVRAAATVKAGIVRLGRKAVPYAGVVHYGWPARGIPARPFAADAAINNQHVWQQAYFDAIEDAIKKIEGKR